MTQRTLLLGSLNPISIFNHQLFPQFLRCELSVPVSASSRAQFPLNFVQNHRNATLNTRSTGIQELVETSSSEFELVEVGFLYRVHGLEGEICVKPTTDFPELRFSKSGRRWLKQRVIGQEKIQEVELVEGRPHSGQKSWILKFRGIDTVDQVKELVGSTLLAKESDRPELEEGEFYARDLVGMRVILKETGEVVGTVANVFNNGGNDLLHVMLGLSTFGPNGNVKSKPEEVGQSGPLVWIPFVKAIVPDVDLNKREMHITPPKGLLELNIRADDRSKKERRQLEWKERKKFQKRLIAAKKKLCELEQQHVFDGFRFGVKSQRNSLAEEIVGVNSKLLQQALHNIELSSKRRNVTEQINDVRAMLLKSTLKISKQYLGFSASEDKLGENFGLHERGEKLLSQGKVSLCLILNDIEKQHERDKSDVEPESTRSSSFSYLQGLLRDGWRFVEEENRALVPLILVCPTQTVQPLQKLFLDNDYFGFDSEKVWLLEEEKLPVVSSSQVEQKKHKILMKSPWEILKSPVGSGGVISSLSSNDILENLTDYGVDYIQICRADEGRVSFNSLLLGFVDAKEAELGIQIPEDLQNLEENLSTIFSVSLLRKLSKEMEKLEFYAVPKPKSHVEKAGKEWVDVVPSASNSLELRASVYSCLNLCLSDKICLLEITE